MRYEKPNHERFDFKTSPIEKAYRLLNAKDPLRLSNLYTAADQKIMRLGKWDYNNPRLITNKVKIILEAVNLKQLTEEEKEWRSEILWFWYHHAISCAIWRYKDKERAMEFSTEAVRIQPKNHPNKITKLLFLLIRDKLTSAEKWASRITEDPEKTTARDLIKEYTQRGFF